MSRSSASAISVAELDFEGLLEHEWLVANGLGGYASSTLCGLNTRRYHGLLVAAMAPPGRRMVLLSRVEESLQCDGRTFDLACNEYPGTVWPAGHELLRAFSADPHPRWAYQGPGWTLQKELRLLRGQNTVLLSYTLLGGGSGIDLEVRPLLALRGMHELCFQWNGKLDAKPRSRGHWHVPATRRTPELFFAHDGTFNRKAHWYLNQIYRRENEYGYAGLEDLWSPGAAHMRLLPGQSMHLACSADPFELRDVLSTAGEQAVEAARQSRISVADVGPPSAATADADFDALLRAVESHALADRDGRTLPAAAQFHWSPPSIRHALAGFTGLYLVPSRLSEAADVLTALVPMLRGGLLPGDYPGDSPGPAPRGADVSLWFINAVHQYLAYGGDEKLVRRQLLPAVLSVLDHYRRGADRCISVDAEGLLNCGSPQIAVTWMDYKVGGVPVTPRHGRAVELSALWYNAQRAAGELCRRFDRPADADALDSSADQTRHAFNRRFWNDATNCCHDVVGDGGVDSAIRPNQLFAISLPFPVLSQDRWASVVRVVREHLLTPFGLRTLSPRDSRYMGRYRGVVGDRDRAAHNGSAYPWLIGPLVTAMVRCADIVPAKPTDTATSVSPTVPPQLAIHGVPIRADQRARATRTPSSATQRSSNARISAVAEARQLLAPCLQHLTTGGLGHLPELCDGEPPHRFGGAIASALSVAELLRCYAEDINRQPPGRSATRIGVADDGVRSPSENERAGSVSEGL